MEASSNFTTLILGHLAPLSYFLLVQSGQNQESGDSSSECIESVDRNVSDLRGCKLAEIQMRCAGATQELI